MTLELWLIAETPAARKFSRVAPGTPRVDEVWIPRSVIRCLTKFPSPGLSSIRCTVEIEDWFAKKIMGGRL